MLEQYSRASERRRISNGIISAITAVNLKADGSSPEEQKNYEDSGRKILEELSNPESKINDIYPQLLNKHGKLIEEVKCTYPTLESRDHLLNLMSIV